MKIFDPISHYYANYLKDKTVILVGGSPHLKLPPTPWPQVVVRINDHVMRQKGHCDVLYHSSVPAPHLDLWDYLSSTAYVFLNLVDEDYHCGAREQPHFYNFLMEGGNNPETQIGFFAQGEWQEKNPYGPEHEWLNDLHKRYDTKFFTGLVALAHIMRFEPAAISVHGMNMYVDQTNGVIVPKIESHGLEGNLTFLRDARKDPRVVFDNELTEALKRYGII